MTYGMENIAQGATAGLGGGLGGGAGGLAGMNPLMLMAVLSALGPQGDPNAGMPSGGFGGIGARSGQGGAYNNQSLGTMLASLRGLVPPAPTPPITALG